MAQYTALQVAIANLKSTLKQFDTQLSAVSTTALAPGATADLQGELVSRVNTMVDKITHLSTDLARVNGSLTS